MFLPLSVFVRLCDGCLSRLVWLTPGLAGQCSFSLMGLRRGGVLVIRVGIQCVIVLIPAAVLVANSCACKCEKGIVLRRLLARSVEFTACAGGCAILRLVGSSYCKPMV